jgi:hypothetical protein
MIFYMLYIFCLYVTTLGVVHGGLARPKLLQLVIRRKFIGTLLVFKLHSSAGDAEPNMDRSTGPRRLSRFLLQHMPTGEVSAAH